MKLPLTLVIPTHNRPHYLQRILRYYESSPFDIVIVDSSVEKYLAVSTNNHFRYLHMPGKTFTQKLANAFNQIDSLYVVMCADDDFIIPAGLLQCLDFLLINQDYSAAGGNIICYQQAKHSQRIDFAPMHTDLLENEVASEDPFARLEAFFDPYRSVFYALHRTALLREAFTAAAAVVQNLYLNEYLTAVVPLAAGKYKELPVFYQVREYSPLSDDKTTVNMDAIVDNDLYREEFGQFISSQAAVVAKITGKSLTACIEELTVIFSGFARRLPGIRNRADTSITKKVGQLLVKFPLIGASIVRIFRSVKTKRELALVIKDRADQQQLLRVKQQIDTFS